MARFPPPPPLLHPLSFSRFALEVPVTSMNSPHVVVLGAGFGGLYAARTLSRAPIRVTLADARNHHLFQPLLYQVATAALNPSDIAMPIRRIFRSRKNIVPLLAKATSIELAQKKVVLADGELSYDFLVIAVGAVNSYYGHDEWGRVSAGLKDIDDARKIRERVLLAYEYAERETDPQKQKEWLTFVIVGGGPTGVELAGAFAEISRHTLSRDFRNIDPKKARIILLQGDERILPNFSPPLSKEARRKLEALGVEVRTSTRVTGIDETGVFLGSEKILARVVIWAAGVKPSPLVKTLGVSLAADGRVPVGPDLSLAGTPEVFVIGDIAFFEEKGKEVPGIAPAAIQEGEHAAKNIIRLLQNKPTLAFHYVNKGVLAAIGRVSAVADLPALKLSGFLAWAAWLFVHIFYLIGFRNRFIVLLDWAWIYFTYERGARLITGDAELDYPRRS